VLIIACPLLLATPALAWNAHGHMTVAAVAFRKLDPAIRKKVDALLKLNPDYPRRRMTVAARAVDASELMMAAISVIWHPDPRRATPITTESGASARARRNRACSRRATAVRPPASGPRTGAAATSTATSPSCEPYRSLWAQS
jgi:hypothetical protein